MTESDCAVRYLLSESRQEGLWLGVVRVMYRRIDYRLATPKQGDRGEIWRKWASAASGSLSSLKTSGHACQSRAGLVLVRRRHPRGPNSTGRGRYGLRVEPRDESRSGCGCGLVPTSGLSAIRLRRLVELLLLVVLLRLNGLLRIALLGVVRLLEVSAAVVARGVAGRLKVAALRKKGGHYESVMEEGGNGE